MPGDSIQASPNLGILGVKFDSKLTFEDHVCDIVSRVSQGILILRLVNRIFVDASLLLHCYFAFVLTILEYCSPVWRFTSIVLWCVGLIVSDLRYNARKPCALPN